jgi:hypothetical protein
MPKERAPITHWIGGWVGLRASLDAVVKRKISRGKGKSRVFPVPNYHTMKVALHILHCDAEMEMSGQLHALAV